MLTWRERLPQLLGLVGVLKDEGVEVGLAADLELDLAGSAALLDARSCRKYNISTCTLYTSQTIRSALSSIFRPIYSISCVSHL